MDKTKQGSAHAQFAEFDSPLVGEMNDIANLALSFGSQIAEMQNVLVELTLAECSESYRELLGARDVPVMSQWHDLSYNGVRTNMRLTRACWEVATRTQGAMLDAMRECMRPSQSASRPARNRVSHAFRERRMQSTVINFPERRRAA
jgi:hypothetical protein